MRIKSKWNVKKKKLKKDWWKNGKGWKKVLEKTWVKRRITKFLIKRNSTIENTRKIEVFRWKVYEYLLDYKILG